MARRRTTSDLPHGREPDAEDFLARLEIARGVEIDPEEDGHPVDSTELFEAGKFRVVASQLFGREERDAAAENNLGCARAWLREYDEAVEALERSAKKGDGEAQARAERNLRLVQQARAAEG